MRNISTEPRCEGCFLKPSVCMCALMAPPVVSPSNVVVMMHRFEHKKSSNTGRLAVRCLAHARIVFHDEPRGDLLVEPKRSVVLFPVAGAQPASDFRGKGPLTLYALDANWRQAARMRKRFAEQGVPFVKAPDTGPSTYALRKGPHAGGMSTLEAIARTLAVIDDVDTAPLLRALELFQDRLLWLRGTKDKDAVLGGIPDGVLRHRA